MLFSVLIPVYNTSKYLDECVQSVLAQSEKDYEIVLLDDGSIDNSGEICDSYAEKYSFIRVVHKQNEGLMMTRRRGFQEAKGDYFICLDSDDYLCDADALSKIKKMIVEKNCNMVLYNFLMEKETRDKDQQISLFEKPNGFVFDSKEKLALYEKLLMGRDLNPMWIKAVSRECVDIDTDYYQWKAYICRGEDLFQSFPMLSNAQRIGYIDNILLHYRWTESSISNNPKLKFYDAYKTIYAREDEYIKIWGIDDALAHKARAKRIPIILGIVVGGYRSTKDNLPVEEWNVFIDRLSKDEFVDKLFSKENTIDVLPYYRLLGALIKGNHKFLLKRTIELQGFLSKKR